MCIRDSPGAEKLPSALRPEKSWDHVIGRGFDSRHLHPMFVVQTHDGRCLSSRLVLCLRAEGESLHVRVEEDVEGLAGLAVDLVVGGDVELVEEGLIGGSPQRVVDAQVQRVAVSGEGQAVVQVCLGPVVFDVSGVDLCFQEPQAASDAVLFSLEQVDGCLLYTSRCV